MVIYKEEVAKVFALYLGCECRLEDGQISDKTTMISADGCLMVDYNGIGDTEHDAECCQLILTSLSDITDEDAIQVAKMTDYYSDEFNLTDFKHRVIEIWATKMFDVSQYLISKHYAIPLWFGINHWANGKTAIELKMAIEK